MLDRALAIARRRDVIFTSFGDMLRVPGSHGDLFGVRARGGDVRVVVSPLDAVRIAQENPDKQVVFFAIGFETTAPANAMSVVQADRLGLDNYSILVSHACVPAAMRAILEAPANRVQAFLAAGHVCAVMGTRDYHDIARRYRVPIVVTGFEPVDLVVGVRAALRQLHEGRADVENAYSRVVATDGNRAAQELVDSVFESGGRTWRGIGPLPDSGLHLRRSFERFDATRRFDVGTLQSAEPAVCIAGEILQGLKKPLQCPAFGTACTPETPLGATMVSDEGACAAYHRYGRRPTMTPPSTNTKPRCTTKAMP
jgi:hydrogenase expression/formation protein HypD